MSDVSAFGKISAAVPMPLPPKADQAIRATGSRGTGSAATENTKIEKSAKDFESILLGSWLQQAEQSFGTVPGGDGDDDADPGKDQFQGMAMQSLGTSMTAAGGIGIAKMISKQLHKAEDMRVTVAAKMQPADAK
jgi:Rod binding domain-containing protein